MRHFLQNGAILLMKLCSRKAPFSTDWRQLESHFAKVAIAKKPSGDLAIIFRSEETNGDRQFAKVAPKLAPEIASEVAPKEAPKVAPKVAPRT